MAFSIIKSDGNDILRISEKGYTYTCGYYTQNCWVDDDRLILTRYKTVPDNDSEKFADIVLVDIKNRTEKVLIHETGKPGFQTIVYGKTLYYLNSDCVLCSIDVDSLERKEIYKIAAEPGQLHMSADGKYMNWFFVDGESKKWICQRIDLKTGEVIKMLEKIFLPPFTVADHFMISPVDPDMLFFVHEGDTTYITNRLWLAPLGKEPYNIAKQRLDKNGVLIDCFGHESWAADGKGLYFIKYDVSPEPPKGICYVDIADPDKSEVLFSKYKYWHVCAADNGKYLAADIGPNDLDENDMGVSGVCLVDLEKKTETKLATVHNMRSHPGHPHPQFNPSCKKVCFNDAVDKDTLSVGIMII